MLRRVLAPGALEEGMTSSFNRARAEQQAPRDVEDFRSHDDLAELRAAGSQFRRFLLDKYAEGSFTASDTCVLAYLHTRSGGVGAEELGLHPDQASRHGSEHLRPVFL